MAIDTAEKRYSMIAFGDGDLVLFEVDGTVDIDDRQHLLGGYSGVIFYGGASVSCALDAVLGAITISSACELTEQGELDSVLGDVIVASAGAPNNQGVLDATIDDVTASSTGIGQCGHLLATLGDVTISSSGVLVHQGVLSKTVASIAISSTAYVLMPGDIALSASIGSVIGPVSIDSSIVSPPGVGGIAVSSR